MASPSSARISSRPSWVVIAIGSSVWSGERGQARGGWEAGTTARPAGRSVDDREAQVVAGNDREQDRVEAVEQTAVRPEDPPRVLDVEVALDRRLEQVAERSQ